MTTLIGLFLRLHGIRRKGGRWVQNDSEVIPEYALVGMLMMVGLGLSVLVIIAACYLLTWIAMATA